MTIFDVIRYPVPEGITSRQMEEIPFHILHDWYMDDLHGIFGSPTIDDIWFRFLCDKSRHLALKALRKRIERMP